MKNALITGGAGFLGPHLVRRLLKEGWQVTAVDNFFNGTKRHLQPFISDPHFVFIEGDITGLDFIRTVIEASKPDMIYHLAAIHFIPYCIANPRETIHVNVTGTQTILDALEHTPTRGFVLASTGDVYLPSDTPHREEDPLGSFNIYGQSKYFCEKLISLAQKKYPKTKFAIARFFNIYGPGETNPHLLPDIFDCLKEGRVLRLGNMDPKRDYIYVEDMAHALYRLATYEGGETVFNIGTGIGSSVWDIVKCLESIIGYPLRVETNPAKVRKTERQNLIADISLIKRVLNWSPSVSLEAGLKSTLQSESIINI